MAARNIIVWDAPNLALAPAVQAQGAGANFLGGAVSAAMNGALAGRLTGEAGVARFDLYGLQGLIYADPSACGLSNPHTLMRGDLARVAQAIDLSRRTTTKIRQYLFRASTSVKPGRCSAACCT